MSQPEPYFDENGVFITNNFWDAESDERTLRNSRRFELMSATSDWILSGANVKNNLEKFRLYALCMFDIREFPSLGEQLIGFADDFGEACYSIGQALYCSGRNLNEVDDYQACEVLFWLDRFDLYSWRFASSFRKAHPEMEVSPRGEKGISVVAEFLKEVDQTVVGVLEKSDLTIEHFLRFGDSLASFQGMLDDPRSSRRKYKADAMRAAHEEFRRSQIE